MIARMSHAKALCRQALSCQALPRQVFPRQVLLNQDLLNQDLLNQDLLHQDLLHQALPRAGAVTALLVLGIGLSGCAGGMSDSMSLDNATLAFVDPARYDFFDCKQLQDERKNLAMGLEDIKKQMEKADTGFAGPVVSEMVYRNDYLSNRGQAKLAEQAWKRNNCHETLPDPIGATAAAKTPDDAKTKPVRSRSGNAVY